jgi:hypothetical protein
MAMALKIAVERNSCDYDNFGSFHGIFQINKKLILLLFWIVDKLQTCLPIRISLVFFRRTLRLKW